MLLHLPIVIATTFSPIQVADTIPKFDIAKECRFESESPHGRQPLIDCGCGQPKRLEMQAES